MLQRLYIDHNEALPVSNLTDDVDGDSDNYTQTPNLGLYKPVVNADYDLWGDHLNANADILDGLLKSTASVSDTAPANPRSGDLWFDGVNAQLFVWYVDPTSAQWVIATAQNSAALVSDTAPPNPTPGEFWFDGVSAQLFVWYVDPTGPGQWVVAVSPPPASQGPSNVLDLGADPTGAADSAPAINAALALGKAVWLPSGTYRLCSALNVGLSQTLYGDGAGSVLAVDSDFDPAAPGVILIAVGPDPISEATLHSTLTHFQIAFKCPDETVTTATAVSAPGATTIQVASAANIQVGYYLANLTHPSSTVSSTVNPAGATVTAIAGTTLTLSLPVAAPGVSIGDQINFAPSRTLYAPLGSASNVAGGTGTQYPWAVYNNGANAFTIDGLFVSGGWNGIYNRGDAFDFRNIAMGVVNVGLDAGYCYNFPVLTNYRFFNWGYQRHPAAIQTYYDGQTVAANIRDAQSISCHNFQSWIGQLNFTSQFLGGTFTNLMMDGAKANISIQGQPGTFLSITGGYSSKGQDTVGSPVTVNVTGDVLFSNFLITNGGPASSMLVQNGRVWYNGGDHFNGITTPNTPAFNVTGGSLYMGAGMRLSNAYGTAGMLNLANSGAGIIQVNGITFTTLGTGGIGFQVTDNAQNYIRNVNWNGWTITGVSSLSLGAYDTPTTSYFHDLTASSGQIHLGIGPLAADAVLSMNTATGQQRYVQYLTGGSLRWAVGVSAVAEGGGNVGANFFANAYDNNGVFLFQPINIPRSTGLVTLARGAAISGGASTIDGALIGGTTPGNANFLQIGGATPGAGNFTFLRSSVAYGITATGSTITDSFQMTTQVCVVGSAPAGTGVRLPLNSVVGDDFEVWNVSVNPVKIYSGATIDGVSGSTGVTLSGNKRCHYKTVSSGVVLSAQLGVASA